MDMAKQAKPGRISRKVFFIIVCSGLALGLAYYVSRISFGELLETVDKISTPNEKLRLVSKISRDILQQDQLQRSQLFLTDNNQYSGFVTGSESIVESLDSLKALYRDNTIQSKRIDSILTLLQERDKLFFAYVQVRKKLVDNRAFAQQMQHINNLIKNTSGIDKTVVTTQKKVQTTTPIKPSIQEDDERGFLAKLFGAKRKTDEATASTPDATIREELNIRVDSIQNMPKQATQIKINQAIRNLRLQQIQQSSTFVNREAELTNAGNVLVNSIFSILHEVEQEAMGQMEADNRQAQVVVNDSVDQITYILLSFILITLILTILIFSDIRKSNNYRLALEQAKEEAEYHSMAKQRFLSNMSHEIRTPLQSIIGFAEQMRIDDPRQNSKLNIIHSASEHLLQIVNEVLDYNRIHSGNFHFSNQVFSVEALAQEVMDAMYPQAERKQLAFEKTVKIAGSGFVSGDVFRLKQILFNLISNAIKFTERGHVRVGISAVEYGTETQLSFIISDTGNGIEEHDLKRIFNEFEQANNFNSGTNFGSGLGLSIVKTLVKNLGGTIDVQTQTGAGSHFTVSFKLPTAKKPQALIEPDNRLIPVNKFEGTIWVVDDDAFILELCDAILNHHQITHRCFSSPLVLLDTIWQDSITHVIMDMRMPEKNGRELCSILRGRIPAHVKLIACTAQALPEERQQILDDGFDALLLKPFKEEDLLRVIGLRAGRRPAKAKTSTFWSNKNELEAIINRFIQDTRSDWKQLKKEVSLQNHEGIEMIAHRMAGRTAQMGEEQVAFRLRKMEIDARSFEMPMNSDIAVIEQGLARFIQTLKNNAQAPSLL